MSLLSAFFISLNFYYSATKETPAAGGTYTEGIVGQPTFINPLITQANEIDFDLTEILFSNLLELTENYKISDDNKIWTISLKKNLKWDDGYDLNADDVVFTVKTVQNPDILSPLFSTWQGVEIEKMDNYEVRFQLKTPYAFFLDNLKKIGRASCRERV